MNQEEFSQLWDMDLHSLGIELRPEEGSVLNSREREKFNELILSHQKVLSEIDKPLTATQHTIETENHLPIAVPPY